MFPENIVKLYSKVAMGVDEACHCDRQERSLVKRQSVVFQQSGLKESCKIVEACRHEERL